MFPPLFCVCCMIRYSSSKSVTIMYTGATCSCSSKVCNCCWSSNPSLDSANKKTLKSCFHPQNSSHQTCTYSLCHLFTGFEWNLLILLMSNHLASINSKLEKGFHFRNIYNTSMFKHLYNISCYLQRRVMTVRKCYIISNIDFVNALPLEAIVDTSHHVRYCE
jgi:hypothetical protein